MPKGYRKPADWDGFAMAVADAMHDEQLAAVKRDSPRQPTYDELRAEVARLKKDAREVCAPRLERQAKEIERLRAVVTATRTYVCGLPSSGSKYDAVITALAALDGPND